VGDFAVGKDVLRYPAHFFFAFEHMQVPAKDERLLFPAVEAIPDVLEIASADVGLIVNG
jgi:hypothetical protein